MFKVIAVDGTDTEHDKSESMIIQSGERYDVEIYTDAPVANYWIRVEDLTIQDGEGARHMSLILGVV